MPAVSSQELVDAVLDAFQTSGTSGILVSNVRSQPRKFIVQTETDGCSLWVYIWTLTRGGRPNLPDEYRIQITSVSPPLQINPNGYTALVGYEPNLKMFAGFDIKRHRDFAQGSPSVQIDINAINRAHGDGLAFDRKNNEEIAVAVRPDQFINYMANAEELHRLGKEAAMSRLLTKASARQIITEDELSKLAPKRKRIISTVDRWARSASFKRQVLFAYGNMCSVTRMQLRLVDAAHIMPVQSEDSEDYVRNGIALSPTYHRAFDNGLIYLDEDYIMRINPAKELQLKTLNLDGGIQDFKSYLDKRIFLPPDKQQWPDIGLIRQANKFRGIGA